MRRESGGSDEPRADEPDGALTPRQPAVHPIDAVPYGVRLAGAWSWRILAVIGCAAVVGWLVVQLNIVVIPVLIAVLLAGLLMPFRNSLIRVGLPKAVAVIVAFLGLLLGIAALVTIVVLALRSGFSGIEQRLQTAYETFLVALRDSPLRIDEAALQGFVDEIARTVQANTGTILSGAVSAGSTVGHIAVGLLLTLFVTLFLLIDGDGIWRWCVRLAPRRARAAVAGAGEAAWLSVGQYVRTQIVVALIDAVGIGGIAALLGVPFPVPIAVLVFLGAFVPFVGALVTGALAVVIALIYNDLPNALLMLGGILVVQQVESHVLQPLLLGTAVRIHPIGVVLAVAVGSLVGGIAGAVFAVPVAAAVNSIVKYIAGGRWKGAPEPDLTPPRRDTPARRRDHRPRPRDVGTVA